MKIKDFNFSIPEELIALKPTKFRHQSKIVEVNEFFKVYSFNDICSFLKKGDCLIINDTKVIPANLRGIQKKKIFSITLNKAVNTNSSQIWHAFVKPLKKIKKGIINFSEKFYGKVIEINRNISGEILLEFNYNNKEFKKLLYKNGIIALPSYISKKRTIENNDFDRYQTVFAEKEGAIAAPTASLHFSKELLEKIKNKGVEIIKVTLHVNGGTFIPIRCKNINDHKMHSEFGEITPESAEKINLCRKNGMKCIAVGTTVLRILEKAKKKNGQIEPFKGETNIFIKPGYSVDSVDGLITNFHTPESTLFILVCSLIGLEKAKKLYQFAVEKKLRFYSYGDSCLIWINKIE